MSQRNFRTPRKLYTNARHCAAKRGIGFDFTYEDWVAWWERHLGKDWIDKRGRKIGQFCMARNGDMGIYRQDNVRCIEVSDNHKEKYSNGRGNFGEINGSAKLTEDDVAFIRQSTCTNAMLAKRFGVDASNISLIKSGKTWAI